MRKLDLPKTCQCLGGCGKELPIEKPCQRTKYVKFGGYYCPDCVRKINSERMKKQNPMSNSETREKMTKKLRLMGHRPTILGGNGRGYTQAQKILAKELGRGWWLELPIPTGHCRDESDLPTNYKVDIANIYYGIAIELDGNCHHGEKARMEDEKKTKFLESKGWKVLRYWNHQVLNDLDSVMAEIMSTILKCKETTITLPMDY
jgi:hypothetical protein